MNDGLIPRRYAKALFLSAKEHGEDVKVYDRMNILEHSFEGQPQLQQVMANPYVSAADKVSLLNTAAEMGDGKGPALVSDFFKLLAQNNRLDMAYMCALAYIDIYRQEKRIYKVTVRTAAPMTPAEEQRLRSLIERHLKGGTMEYTTSVDPSLIGGFTVSVGNELLDASISNELKQLRLNLLSK